MGDCATLGIIADALQLKENISSDCCAWDLSKVACFGGRITQIDFRKLGLTGYIHPNISSLSELYILRLDRNDISGRLPNSLGLLDKLYTFGIAETKVEGEIPVEMASMNSLQSLDLTNTRISGLIPAALAQRRIAGLSSTCPYSDNLCLDSTTRPFGCDQIDFKCKSESSNSSVLVIAVSLAVLAVIGLIIYLIFKCRHTMQLSKALQQSKNQKALENAPSNPSIAAFGGYGNYLTKELNVESKEREDQHIVKAPRTSLWSLVREKRPTIVDRNYPSIYPTIPMPEHALESITETNPRSQKLDPESALYAYDASLIRYNPKTGDFYLSN